jgi:uncharacterized protein YceK
MFLPIISGCMSFATLMDSDEEKRFIACANSSQTVSRTYLGTKLDLVAIPHIVEGGAGDVSILFLFDLPFSVVVDTALLPVTLYLQNTKGDISCQPPIPPIFELSDQPNTDLAKYPQEWIPPTIQANKDCTAIYHTFGMSRDADAEKHYRAFSELLLRTSDGINKSSRLKIYQSTSDPDFIIVDAFNEKRLVESSSIRAACNSGVLLIYPQTSSIPSSDGKITSSHFGRFYNSGERFLVMGDSVEQCKIISSKKRKSCSTSHHWFRLQRIGQ